MYDLLERLEALIEKWENVPYTGDYTKAAKSVCAHELRQVIGQPTQRPAAPDLLAALERVRDRAKAPQNRGAMTQLQMCRFLDDLLAEIGDALAGARGAGDDLYPVVDDGAAWGGSPDGWPD